MEKLAIRWHQSNPMDALSSYKKRCRFRRFILDEDIAVTYVLVSLFGPGNWQERFAPSLYESMPDDSITQALDQEAQSLLTQHNREEWRVIVRESFAHLNLGDMRSAASFEREFPLAHGLFRKLRGNSSMRSVSAVDKIDLFLLACHPHYKEMMAGEESDAARVEAWKHEHPSSRGLYEEEVMKILRYMSNYACVKPRMRQTLRQKRRNPKTQQPKK